MVDSGLREGDNLKSRSGGRAGEFAIIDAGRRATLARP
jgi:hypothetical protein